MCPTLPLLAHQGSPGCFLSVLCPPWRSGPHLGDFSLGFPPSTSSHLWLGRWRLGDSRVGQTDTQSGPGSQAPEAQRTPPHFGAKAHGSQELAALSSPRKAWAFTVHFWTGAGAQVARTQKAASLLQCPLRAPRCCAGHFLKYILPIVKQKTGTEGKEESWARMKDRAGSGQAECRQPPAQQRGTQEGNARSAGVWHREEMGHLGPGAPLCHPLYKGQGVVLSQPDPSVSMGWGVMREALSAGERCAFVG